MRVQLLTGVRALVVLTVLAGLAFPLLMTGAAQVAFGDRANGSLLERDGQVVASELVGQAFSGEQYFHPRPSAAAPGASGSMVEVLAEDGQPTGELVPADLADLSQVASGASNLGPINDDLLVAIDERVAAYRVQNGIDADAPVPVDAVTASGSGLDPHISVANARLQAPRVARARGMVVDAVLGLVAEHTTSRLWGVLGEEAVNVLTLNLALDDREQTR